MKKQILISLILFASILTANAQVYTPRGTIQGSSGNNNLGIGVSSPEVPLTVYGISHFYPNMSPTRDMRVFSIGCTLSNTIRIYENRIKIYFT